MSPLAFPGRIRQSEWSMSGMGQPYPGTVGSRTRIRIFHPQPLGCCRRVEFDIRRDQHPCKNEPTRVACGSIAQRTTGIAQRTLGFSAQTLYEVEAVVPPRPVQLVWKNWPRGRSTRS